MSAPRKLTPELEREVYRMRRAGVAEKTIAFRLGISRQTILTRCGPRRVLERAS